MKNLLLILLCTYHSISFSQVNGLHFKKFLADSPDVLTCFAIENLGIPTLQLLENEKIYAKAITKEWIYVTTTARWIDQNSRTNTIGNVYFERSNPKPMSDTTLMRHKVKLLHNGDILNTVLKGKNVIMGYLDNGLDYNHLDFRDASGNTRVLHFWDQAQPIDGTTPLPYAYGATCDSTMIANGTCAYNDTQGHGTTVAGVGSGNALANGRNLGLAPESKIIIVKTNQNAANWTLTVADACAYIFEKADALNLPAVINISYGDYFGSHDNLDPASMLMENLVDTQNGRVIVAAAGNAGSIGKWHINFDKPITDTSSTWMIPNPSGAISINNCYFDMWADASIAPTLRMSIAIDKISPTVVERANIPFFAANSALSTTVVIPINTSGAQLLGTAYMFKEIINGRLHIEGYIDIPDSNQYRVRINTTGANGMDAWSGAAFGYSNFVSDPILANQLPNLNTYVFPDTLKTMVSSWVNSDHIITVGNVGNKSSYIDVNNNPYFPGSVTTPYKLSIASSKGPTRLNLQKPDVSACGDMTLSAGPLSVLAANAGTNLIGQGGMHIRNGGTSIASPVVAGIAALYLSYCPNASWQEVKSAIIKAAEPTMFSGTVPNYGYGFGFVNAEKIFDSLNQVYLTSLYQCPNPTLVTTNPLFTSIAWNTLETTDTIYVATPGDISAIAVNNSGCKLYDTITITALLPAVIPIIGYSGGQIYTVTNFPGTGVINWNIDGNNVGTGLTFDYTGQSTGILTATHTSTTNCIETSIAVAVTASLDASDATTFSIWPNPSSSFFNYKSEMDLVKLEIFNMTGKSMFISEKPTTQGKIDVSHYSKGVYFMHIEVNDMKVVCKITVK
jgi:hypothetical protein